MKWIIYELRILNQVKLWSSQISQLRREAWKIQTLLKFFEASLRNCKNSFITVRIIASLESWIACGVVYKLNQIKLIPIKSYWFLRRVENRSTRRETSRSRVENKQAQPTYVSGSGNRTQLLDFAVKLYLKIVILIFAFRKSSTWTYTTIICMAM